MEYLTGKIPDMQKKDRINFCVKCFKGYMLLDYQTKKGGYGLKCEFCKFRIQVLQNVMKADREDEKCEECGSF